MVLVGVLSEDHKSERSVRGLPPQSDARSKSRKRRNPGRLADKMPLSRFRPSDAILDDLPRRGGTGCPMSYPEYRKTNSHLQAAETTYWDDKPLARLPIVSIFRGFL